MALYLINKAQGKLNYFSFLIGSTAFMGRGRFSAS
jgi:hypothetical protein